MRIRSYDGTDSIGYGSGTILVSNERGGELVLTARHVVRNAKRVTVEHRGKQYPATQKHLSLGADLAALEVDLPGSYPVQPASRIPGREAVFYGFGKSGQLEAHRMTWIANHRGWNEYTPGPDDGDSGAGVFAEDGSLFGVAVAQAREDRHAVLVSAYALTKFLAALPDQPRKQPGQPVDLVAILTRIEARLAALEARAGR